MAWQQMFGTDVGCFRVLIVGLLVALAWRVGRGISSTREDDATERR